MFAFANASHHPPSLPCQLYTITSLQSSVPTTSRAPPHGSRSHSMLAGRHHVWDEAASPAVPLRVPSQTPSLASSAVYSSGGDCDCADSMWLHWSQGPCSCLQAQPLSQLTPLLQLVTSPSICVPACPPTWSLTPVSTALCTHRHRMCSHRRALWQPRPWQLQVSL